MKAVRFHLAEGCRVMLNGIPMVLKEVAAEDALLARTDTGQSLRMSRWELARMASEGALVFVDGLAAQPVTREARPVPWERLDPAKLARIRFRMAYVNALKKLEHRSPDNPVFRMAVAEIAQRRGDQPAPAPRTVYRWISNYRASGYDSDALAREYVTRKGRTGRIGPEVRALIQQKLLEKMGKAGATLSGVYPAVIQEVAAELGLDVSAKLSQDARKASR
jgi:hypothetical protein